MSTPSEMLLSFLDEFLWAYLDVGMNIVKLKKMISSECGFLDEPAIDDFDEGVRG